MTGGGWLRGRVPQGGGGFGVLCFHVNVFAFLVFDVCFLVFMVHVVFLYV